MDHEGRITEYSLAKNVAAGRLPEIGSVMYRDYAANHKIDMHAELMACIQSGTPREFPEQPYEDKIYHIRMSPFSGGAVITSLEITSLKQAEKKFFRLVAAIEEAGEEILVFDQKGRVEFANTSFLNRTGISREAIFGTAYDDEKLAVMGDLFVEKMRQVIADGEPWAGRVARGGQDSREEGALSLTPVKDGKGSLLGCVSISSPVVDEGREDI